MVREPIVFLNKTYKSQSAFEVYVRGLIYIDIGECLDVAKCHPDKYIELLEVLKRHPEYLSKTENIKSLKIRRDKLNRSGLQLLIMNIDSSETDISWKTAITGKHTKFEHELRGAFRTSVDAQIKRFKANSKQKCGLCDRIYGEFHADHIVHFEALVQDFLEICAKNEKKIPTILDSMTDGTFRRCFSTKDNSFKDEWYLYHENHASLRILCKTCNLTRPKFKKIK